MASPKLKQLVKKKVKTRKPFKDFVVKTKNKLKNSEDFKTLKNALLSILIYGLTASPLLILFNFNYSLSLILGVGSFLYIFEKRILDMLCRFFGSIKLVVINR